MLIVTERESRGRPEGGADDNDAAILSATGVDDPLGGRMEVAEEIVGGERDIMEAAEHATVEGDERVGARTGC